jgi:ABC-2 type transport system ATP-binding protein
MIEVDAVSKTFVKGIFHKEYVKAVDNVSFDVKDRECFGLLGPNGAGKTSIIQIMCTLALPDSGTVRIADFDVVKDVWAARQISNVVLGEKLIYYKLNAYENLDFFGKIYGLSKQERVHRIHHLLKAFDMWEKKDILVEDLSRGMKQRVTIARSLMNYPDVLFLDEPTSGLDPINALSAREFIKETADEEDITIVLTTHNMAEAEDMCDRIAIMNFGRIIACSTAKDLRKLMKKEDVVEVKYAGVLPSHFKFKVNGVREVVVNEDVIRIHIKDAEAEMHNLLDELFKLKIRIREVHTIAPTMEDVFVHLTGKRLEEIEAEK